MLLCPRSSQGASCALMWLKERCSRKEMENTEKVGYKAWNPTTPGHLAGPVAPATSTPLLSYWKSLFFLVVNAALSHEMRQGWTFRWKESTSLLHQLCSDRRGRGRAQSPTAPHPEEPTSEQPDQSIPFPAVQVGPLHRLRHSALITCKFHRSFLENQRVILISTILLTIWFH